LLALHWTYPKSVLLNFWCFLNLMLKCLLLINQYFYMTCCVLLFRFRIARNPFTQWHCVMPLSSGAKMCQNQPYLEAWAGMCRKEQW
jgi:hypothetical protein